MKVRAGQVLNDSRWPRCATTQSVVFERRSSELAEPLPTTADRPYSQIRRVPL